MDEAARLQHELAMLRERYAIMERNGRRIAQREARLRELAR